MAMIEVTLWHIVFLLIGAGITAIVVSVAFVMKPVILKYLEISRRAREIAEIIKAQEEKGKYVFYVDDQFMKKLAKSLKKKNVDLEKLMEEIE